MITIATNELNDIYTDASGNKFRTAKIGDKTYYAYNDEVLTKEKYEAKLRAAKG